MCRLLLPSFAILLALSGCDAEGLLVDLKTDFTPGIDFAVVRTEVLYAGGAEQARADATFGVDYISGQRVAEITGLEPGGITVRVALLDASDMVVATRSYALELSGNYGLTAIITRDCAGVICPGAMDPAGAVTCQSGVCVDELCSVETPASCPAPECMVDTDCRAPAACAIGRCADGVCLSEGQHAMCTETQYCDPDRGCLNRDGSAGNETPIPPGEIVPVKLRAGYYHTCALYSNGGVKCWGNNDAGQLGYGHFETLGDDPMEVGDDALPFLDFGTTDRVVDIGAGQWHTCALFESGRVKCWGQNQAGSLGNELPGTFGDQPGELASASTDYLMPSGLQPVRMRVLKRNVCIVYDDGSLRCSGQNDYGQLGTESFSSLGDEPGEMGDSLLPIDLGAGVTVEDVVVGEYHSCALIVGGTVKCWGRGNYGRLGRGNTGHFGGNPGDMGDMLPPLDFGAGRTATAIHRGWFGDCVTLDDGTNACWGSNLSGELGLGDVNNIGDRPEEMGDGLPEFAPGLDVTAILGGFQVWCVIDEARALRCLGRNSSGELGLGDLNGRGATPGETWASQPPIDLGTGRIMRGTSSDNLAIGLAHVCALPDDFRIRCWGANEFGQLFVGDVANRGDDPDETGDSLTSFRP